MRPEAGQLVKGTLWVTASRVVEGVVALAYSIIVARWLGGDYGFIGAAMGVWGVLNILTRMGIPQASTRYVANLQAKGEHKAARETIRDTFVLEAVLSVVYGVALFLMADVLADQVFGKAEMAPHLRIVSPMLVLAGVAGVWLSVVQGLHRYGAFALQVWVNPVVRLGASVLFLLLGWGVEGALLGYVLGHAAAMVVGVVTALAAIRSDLPLDVGLSSDIKGAPGPSGLVRFGAAVTIGTTAAVVFEWTDKLMLAALQPIEDVAFYTIAFGMVSLPLLLPRAINITFYPTISSLEGAGDMDGLRRTTERVMRLTMLMMAFIPVGMMAIAPWIVELLYGEFFLPAVAPFIILSIWGLIRPVGLLAYSIPKGMGKPMVGAWAMVLTAVLNVVLNAVLIPLYGLEGAAVATTVSYIVGFAYLTVVALRMVGARFPWVPIVKSVFSALVAGAVMFLLFLVTDPEVGPVENVLWLAVVTVGTALAGLGIYVMGLGFAGAVVREDADLVRTLGVPGAESLALLVQAIAGMKLLRDRWLGWDRPGRDREDG